MASNRIQKFDKLWQAGEHDRASNPPNQVPAGFAVVPLAQLPAELRQATAERAAIYQRAYDAARAAAEEKFVHDWII